MFQCQWGFIHLWEVPSVYARAQTARWHRWFPGQTQAAHPTPISSFSHFFFPSSSLDLVGNKPAGHTIHTRTHTNSHTHPSIYPVTAGSSVCEREAVFPPAVWPSGRSAHLGGHP